MFFFEKKNQKTFIRVPLALARAQANEVFFASFLFTKKKILASIVFAFAASGIETRRGSRRRHGGVCPAPGHPGGC
jgi:hypothetical protein